MIELELFYNMAICSIREEQAAYLKRQKRQPFAQVLPEVSEVSAQAYAKMKFWARVLYRLEIRKQRKRLKRALRAQKVPVDERISRGYNAGIELALRVLEDEFLAFKKRLKNQEQ